MHDMRQQVVMLEKKLRILSCTVCAAFGLCIVVAVLGVSADPVPAESGVPAQSHDQMKVKHIEVVNKQGRVVFSVTSDAVGNGVLTLKYSEDKPLLEVRAADFGQPALALNDASGKALAVLGSNPKGDGGMLQLTNDRGFPVVSIESNKSGDGHITLCNRTAKQKRELGPVD